MLWGPSWWRWGFCHPPDIPVPQFGNVEAITTAIMDEFPALRERGRKMILLGVLCFSFYLLGLLLVTQVCGAHAGCILGGTEGCACTLHGPQVLTPRPAHSQGGIFWFTLIDTYSTGFGLIIITLLMCVGIACCYGERSWGAPRSGAGGPHGAELGGSMGQSLGVLWSKAGGGCVEWSWGVLWSCEVPCTLGSGFSTAPQHVGPLSTIPVSWGGTGVVCARHRALRGWGAAVTPCVPQALRGSAGTS